MNDRQLQALLKLALEAERLEQPASAPAPIAWWRRAWAKGGFAAAAAVLLAAPLFWSRPAPMPQDPAETRLTPVAARTLSDEDLGAIQNALAEMFADPLNAEQRVALVVAIARGEQGECDCIRWKRHTLPEGKALADLSKNELLRLGMQDSCAGTSSRLLVVGVACDEIPLDGTLAGQVASCVNTDGCGDTGACYASRALACLPDDATVVAATLAMSR